MALFTIGHSTLDIPDFVAIAGRMPVDKPRIIMDVRSHPTSKWPQFWREKLEKWLPKNDLEYVWEPRLGGWTAEHMQYAKYFADVGVDIAVYSRGKFPKQRIGKDRPPRAEGAPEWTNQGLYDYSWVTGLPEWQQAGRDLLHLGRDNHVAIMCAEGLWWKCHRSMVADWVVWKKRKIVHLQPKMTDHGRVIGNRIERYHPRIRAAWNTGGFSL